MNFSKLKTVAAAGSLTIASALFSGQALANGFVIDSFDGTYVPMSVLPDAGGTTQTAVTTQAGTMLGGERDIIIQNFSTGPDFVTATVGEFAGNGGQLSFNTGDSTGAIRVEWDGAGNGAAFNETGLGSVDLSGFESFALDVLYADGDFFFEIGAFTDVDTFSIVQLQANEVIAGSPEAFTIDFSLFSQCGLFYVTCGPDGAVDFGSVGAIYAAATGAATIDFGISEASVVPAPGALALMGLGLVGLAGIARRKKQA